MDRIKYIKEAKDAFLRRNCVQPDTIVLNPKVLDNIFSNEMQISMKNLLGMRIIRDEDCCMDEALVFNSNFKFKLEDEQNGNNTKNSN